MATPAFNLNASLVRDDHALFFAQLDLFFRQKAIMDQTEKFCFVVSILPQDTITEVRELIITPPTEKPYDVPRETVTTSVTASTHKRISQLLEQETIGDSKLSQFLKRLQKLAEGATDKSIVKYIFLQRIPTQYKVAIAAQDESTTVEQLAVIADHIADILSTQSPAISSVQMSDRHDLLMKLMEGQKQMEVHMEDIARLTFKQKQGQRNWVTRSQSRERRQKKAICWKHKRFGENANSCIPPCNYKVQGKA